MDGFQGSQERACGCAGLKISVWVSTMVAIDTDGVKMSRQVLWKTSGLGPIIEQFAGFILVTVPASADLSLVNSIEKRVEYIAPTNLHRILRTALHSPSCGLQVTTHSKGAYFLPGGLAKGVLPPDRQTVIMILLENLFR